MSRYVLLTCPHCQRSGLKVRPEYLGQLVCCKHCEQTFTAVADGAQAPDGVLGWLHSVARKHVEVALGHPARLIANALGPPPPDVIASAHERGMLVAALAGKAEHARRQVASGVDIVVAQGYEAGGHTGEIATMVLVPEIVDAVGTSTTSNTDNAAQMSSSMREPYIRAIGKFSSRSAFPRDR